MVKQLRDCSVAVNRTR